MSRTSPGRYALHEFAKNVYAVRAIDGTGRSLAVTKPNPHQWHVERIRPATLEPFDFEHANMSRELWLAEGFTSFDLTLDDFMRAMWRAYGVTEVPYTTSVRQITDPVAARLARASGSRSRVAARGATSKSRSGRARGSRS